MRSSSWLNGAAVVTWAVVSVPTLVDLLSGRLSSGRAVVWTLATITFGLLLRLCIWPSRLGSARRLPLLVLQAACGLVITWINPNGASAAMLVIVAAQVPYAMSSRKAWLWIVGQTLVLIAVFTQQAGLIDALSIGIAFGGFQMFAVATTLLAISERLARDELTVAHAELTATRELLAENSRVGERLRISRDLHDTLGHHLTALSLQLEVASRLAVGQPSQSHVLQAHAITRLLLGDVRDVVSQMRDSSRINLTAALRSLAHIPSSLRVQLDAPDVLEFSDPAHAHALLRAVQEIVTNASRHAKATTLTIRIAQDEAGVTLAARDDGLGAGDVAMGNGLRGMRERFEAQHGRLDIATAPGGGFEVHGFMPNPEPAP